MLTDITEINDGIYRLSTFVPEVGPTGFAFNQFLVDADEPLLFHTGARQMFPLVSAAVASIIPIERLRWISFGHVESDECGAMNQFLAAAPESQVVFNATGVMVSLNDLADRPPRILGDGEVLDIGGKRIRMVETPHVPHGWEAQVLFEETTGTLFTGDLFTALGNRPAITSDDIVAPAMEGEALFRASSLSPNMTDVLERLADLRPTTLALMHGSTYKGDGAAQLRALAQAYDERYLAAV
jgi:flavorubredoxin